MKSRLRRTSRAREKEENSIYKTINFIHAFGRLRFSKSVALKRDSFQVVINFFDFSFSTNFLFIWKTCWKLWKFITQMTSKTRTVLIIYTLISDKRERNKDRNTKHQRAHFRGLCPRVWVDDGKSLHGVCECRSLTIITLCVFFIWRIYGHLYHKYFAKRDVRSFKRKKIGTRFLKNLIFLRQN